MQLFMNTSLIRFVRLCLVLLPCSLAVSSITAQPSYRSLLQQQYNNVQHYYYDTAARLYRDEKVHTDNGKHPYSYLWPLCGLLQAANEKEVLTGKPAFDSIWQVVEAYYDQRPPAPAYASYIPRLGGGDRFYDDNQWIGIALMDNYARTHRHLYLEKATAIYRFMMTGFDTASGGGLYWEEGKKNTKNTCSNGPGIILALQLYQATQQRGYLDTALLLYRWVNAHLQSPDNLYYDNLNMQTLQANKQVYSYNTGTMLQANVYLYEITHRQAYLDTATVIARAAARYFCGAGTFKDSYWFNAVLLRGLQHLRKYNADNSFIDAFDQCTRNALLQDKNDNGLMGKTHNHVLVDQAGMLEILARMAKIKES